MRPPITARRNSAFALPNKLTFRTLKAQCLLVIAMLVVSVTAVRSQSALDGFDPNVLGLPGDAVTAMAVQPDGKILIGGTFKTLAPNGGATVTRNRIARLNPDGTLDTAFNPNVSAPSDAVVRVIVVQADGKILVGGTFTNIGGQARSGIARLDGATGLADSFDPNPSGDFGSAVYSIAVQADGKILVGGVFSNIGGLTRNYIARLDATTGLADSFDPDVSADFVPSVDAIVVQADGKILVGGLFTSIGGQTRNYIARLDPTTGLADAFDPNADGPVAAFAQQADGRILVGGRFFNIGGQVRTYVARLDATTGLADSFNPNPNNSGPSNAAVTSISIQADGKILVGGGFANIGGQSRNHIARLNANTGLADSFDPSAHGAMSSHRLN